MKFKGRLLSACIAGMLAATPLSANIALTEMTVSAASGGSALLSYDYGIKRGTEDMCNYFLSKYSIRDVTRALFDERAAVSFKDRAKKYAAFCTDVNDAVYSASQNIQYYSQKYAGYYNSNLLDLKLYTSGNSTENRICSELEALYNSAAQIEDKLYEINHEYTDDDRAVMIAALAGNKSDWNGKDSLMSRFKALANKCSADPKGRNIYDIVFDIAAKKVMFSGEAYDISYTYAGYVTYEFLGIYAAMIPILDAQLTVSEFSDKQKSGLSKSVSEVYNKLDLIGADAAAEQINSVTKQMFDEYSSESIISRYASYCYNRDYDRNVFVNYGKASVPIAKKLEEVKPPFGPGLYNEKAVKSDAEGEKYYSKLKEDLTNDLKKDPILSNGVCLSDLSDYVKSDNFRWSYGSVYDYLEAQGIVARQLYDNGLNNISEDYLFRQVNNFLDGGRNVEFFPASQVLTEVYDYDTFPLGRGEGDLTDINKGDHIYVNAITPKGTKGDLCLYKRLETIHYKNDYLGDTHVFLSTDWTMLGFRETKRSKAAEPARKCRSYMEEMCLNDDRRPDRTYPVDKDDIIPVSENTGSVFSGGNIWIIIVVIGLFTVVVAVSVVIYIKSKKKAAAFAQADASEAFENTETFDTLETPEQTDTSEPSEQSEPSEPSE